MNPKIPQFYVLFTPCDKTLWGLGRTKEAALSDGQRYIKEYRQDYPRHLVNARVEIAPASKKLYDVIMQYGSFDKQWKLVNGVAELIMQSKSRTKDNYIRL